MVFTKGFAFSKQPLRSALQKSEVKNAERARNSTNLLKMNSVKGIFSGIFPKICVTDLERTISKNTFFWFRFDFSLYCTGRKIYSLFVLLDI